MNKAPGPTLKFLLSVLNQLYEIERKLKAHGDQGNALRNVERIRTELDENTQLFYEDPIGEAFDETRTDVEASISGPGTDSLTVVEVTKPIVRMRSLHASYSRVVQKGIVVVQSKQSQE